MEIIVILILTLATLVFVLYPFFKTAPKVVGSIKEKPSSLSVVDVDDEIERQVRERRQQRGNFCPQCGAVVKAKARYCSHCGFKLAGGKRNG